MIVFWGTLCRKLFWPPVLNSKFIFAVIAISPWLGLVCNFFKSEFLLFLLSVFFYGYYDATFRETNLERKHTLQNKSWRRLLFSISLTTFALFLKKFIQYILLSVLLSLNLPQDNVVKPTRASYRGLTQAWNNDYDPFKAGSGSSWPFWRQFGSPPHRPGPT